MKCNDIKKGVFRVEDVKDKCEVCGKKAESTFSRNLEKYMCQECWDDYGEACHNGYA